MPQGKQTSFSYGEVSPSLQYKSNAVSYSEGLAQLTNGFVHIDGGVSNRSGFKYLNTVDTNVTDNGLKQGQQLSVIRGVKDLTNLGVSLIVRYENALWPATNDDTVELINPNTVDFSILDLGSHSPTKYTPNRNPALGGDPRLFQVATTSGRWIFSFGESSNADQNFLQAVDILDTPGSISRQMLGFLIAGNTGEITNNTRVGGSAPTNLPVYYIITYLYTNGEEKVVYAGIPSTPGVVGHPHANFYCGFDLVNAVLSDDVQSMNIYRSAGTLNSVFSLVSRIPVTDTAATTVPINDFVTVGDITANPPINSRLWGPQFRTDTFDVNSYLDQRLLCSVRRTMSYQQRVFAAMDPTDYGDTWEGKEGTISVSKLGTSGYFHCPDIYTATSAFDFTLPLSKGDFVTHMVPMDRALIFTSGSIYMLQGSGEQGFITPTEVNPVEIFDEGASRYVEPVVSGDACFFMAKDHRRIYAISIKGNQYEINNIGVLSDHFFDEDVVEMAITRGRTSILWILRRDGKVVSVSLGSNPGFALHETQGLITSITSSEVQAPFNKEGYSDPTDLVRPMDYNLADQETLFVQVLRDVNGQRNRYIETLTPRLDGDGLEEGFAYMDSHMNFGARLTLMQDGKYIAYNTDDLTDDLRVPLNIQDGTTYAAGEAINLRAGSDLTAELGLKSYVDFYYDENIEDVDTGETITIKRTIRFTRNGTATWDAVDFLMPGYFDQDVPAALRDATTLAADDMLAVQTRYCVPQQNLSGLTHLVGKEVSIFADNRVISSPNSPDPDMATLTVDGSGNLDLGDYYGYVVVGLPYTTTIESLDIESSGDRTMTDANKNLNEIGMALVNTRQGYVSHSGAKLDLSKFEKLRYRTDEAFDSPDRNYSGYLPVPIQGSWDAKGRTVIKQLDPLPISVLSIYPKGVSSAE